MLVLGSLDVCCDHPVVPPGEKVATLADENRLGLDKCVASYVLPENVVWWKVDNAGRYVEAVVMEYVDPSDRNDFDSRGKPINPDGKDEASKKWINSYVRWRHWTATESTVYNYEGDEVIDTLKHSFGRVPITREICQKKHRTPHIGKSLYENIAQLQREFYNRVSELIVSDTIQAHPMLSMPEEYCKADNTVSVGPFNILPMKKDMEKGGYQEPIYVSPPKDPAESLRKNLADIRDQVDRRAALTKPAGVQGSTGGTVGQSGISKQLDAVNGNDLLSKIAKILAEAEKGIAEYALLVLLGRTPTDEELEAIEINYPTTFELYSADEILASALQFQSLIASSGTAPAAEFEIMACAFRKLIPGLADETYKLIDAEFLKGLEAKSGIKEQEGELKLAAMSSHQDALENAGADGTGEKDPTGVSAGTAVSGMTGSGL